MRTSTRMTMTSLSMMSFIPATAACVESAVMPNETETVEESTAAENESFNDQKLVDVKDDRPNIVVIIADDLLSSEISCYGGKNINTPNIDRLAAEGVRFTGMYASEAMSVPLRACMYTGMYPASNGSYRNHKAPYPWVKSVNDYMPAVGYRVGRTGKNHPVGLDTFNEIEGFTVGCTANKAPYQTDGIKSWMKESDAPFLLYVCSIHPHAPWNWGNPNEFNPDKLVLPDNHVDSPDTRKMYCKYLAEIRALDNEVGDVLKALEDIGELDNTIVMFLGEQGPQIPGGKWTLWHQGVSSAMVARYPKKIPAGSVNNALVQYEDLLPTFIDIAGGDPIPGMDGRSFKNVLLEGEQQFREYVYGIHNNVPEGREYPIRSIRNDRYGLIWNLTPEVEYHEKHLMNLENPNSSWAVWLKSIDVDPDAQMLCDRFVHRPEIEFYDIVNDPYELNNLAGDKQYESLIATMMDELKAWMKQQKDDGVNIKDHPDPRK